jgi:hypothetical protein
MDEVFYFLGFIFITRACSRGSSIFGDNVMIGRPKHQGRCRHENKTSKHCTV